MKAETRYARSGGVNIAYQVVGDGPRDIVLVPGWISNLEVFWEDVSVVRFFERLASFSRLIMFDKRGTGISDRVAELPDLETRMDDVRAVMDAVGSERAALLGYSEGGPMCMFFAATYPTRTTALITVGSFARRLWAPDHPWGPTSDERRQRIAEAETQWPQLADLDLRAPSLAKRPGAREWWVRFLRLSASPAAAGALLRMNSEIDVRHLLPAIRVPTLVMHSRGDVTVDAGASRYMAAHIRGSRYVELPGSDHLPWGEDADAIVDEVEEFLTGVRHGPDPDRVLATVVFTDIVDATGKAAELGDHRWRTVLSAHHARVRGELARFRGREIDTAGDGFLAVFDGPARAVRAARTITESVRSLGIEVRAGVHTGECEVMGEKLSGIAVHIGARVAALAGPGEVLTSSTVKDLVAGSGLRFRERGVHELRGVPGTWQLYSVEKD